LSGTIASVSGSCPTVALVIAGRLVVTDRETEYKKLKCGDLRPGLTVEVNGTQRSDGSLLAQKIERKEGDH
jgi:hypothetical protein